MGAVADFVEGAAGAAVDVVEGAAGAASEALESAGSLVQDAGEAVSGAVEPIVESFSDVVEPVVSAGEDLLSGATGIVEDVGDTVLKTVEKVGDTVTGIIEDPKKLAAVAISVAFPAAGVAIGESLLGPAMAASLGAAGTQVVGQTIINTIINGGDLENALLTAGVSVMTPALAKEISAEAVSQGITKTVADAGAKVAAGTVSAAALGQDPMVALTFGAVDQATNAVLDKALTESGVRKEFDALPDTAKIAVSASITSALTGADASTLAANQIVQKAIGSARQEIAKQTKEPTVTSKTNEEQIAEFLQSNGVNPTPELVASYAKDLGVSLTDTANTQEDYNNKVNDIVAENLKSVPIAFAGDGNIGVYDEALKKANKELADLLERVSTKPNSATELQKLEKALFKVGTSIGGVISVGKELGTYTKELNTNEEQELVKRLESGKIELSPSPAGAGRGFVNPPSVEVATPVAKPEYQVQPADYRSTVEEVQPWQNVYNKSWDDIDVDLPVTADVQRVASMLNVDTQTAMQIAQANKALFDYLTQGGEPEFKPADPETMRSTDKVVVSRPGADDNIVIQRNEPLTFTKASGDTASKVLQDTQKTLAQPDIDIQPYTQTKAEPTIQEQTIAKAQPTTQEQTIAKAQPTTQEQTIAKAQPTIQEETKTDTKTDIKPDSLAKPEIQVKTDSKTETDEEVKPKITEEKPITTDDEVIVLPPDNKPKPPIDEEKPKPPKDIIPPTIEDEDKPEPPKDITPPTTEDSRTPVTTPNVPQTPAQPSKPSTPTTLTTLAKTATALPFAIAGNQIIDDSIPLAKPEFLTTKGDTGFKGILEEFQQKVEGLPFFLDNSNTRQETTDMAPFYSYGNETPVESILGLGGDQKTDSTDSSENPYEVSQTPMQKSYFASGGMVTPLMAASGGFTGTRHGRYAGGGTPSPLVAAGGKMRVDFRHGDAVSGKGDGQSDDIPAMLADGEFVFPADVVAAIGNGSTKAGSDALYDMMHSIRAHVRSAKPKDLPPEIKSPLDFLKTSKKRSA